MNYCPITYRECGDSDYSREGLRLLDTRLTHLSPLPFTAAEQRREAIRLSGKLSIQGMQPKLSAILSMKEETFEPVEQYGRYILKPQHPDYPQLPENEGITMQMARLTDLEVPLSGLVYSADRSLTYFIRRFDRIGRRKKLAVEDFAQLSGEERSTKYHSSMEKVAGLVEKHCTFPAVEKLRLFQRTLFCWLTGNEDMHLKNFSIIRRDGKITLSPIYDCLNSTAVYRTIGRNPKKTEELALPLNGKKRNLTKRDFVDYYGFGRLGLSIKVVDSTLEKFSEVISNWLDLIEISFLDETMKNHYREVVKHNARILGI